MNSLLNRKALVLMSGGQDSATSLVWAKKNFDEVEAISFYYQQKHQMETTAAKKICDHFAVPNKLVDISFIAGIVKSNLFTDTGSVNDEHPLQPEVPASYVPYRNLLFLTVAAGWASTIGANHIVMGVCQTDYSGYADCRDDFIKAVQVALNLSTDFAASKLVLHTPLMWLTKADEFKMAEELGCLDIILQETLTCYNGVEKMNAYGKGCGECPACILRKNGYMEYLNKYGVKI